MTKDRLHEIFRLAFTRAHDDLSIIGSKYELLMSTYCKLDMKSLTRKNVIIN